MKRGVYWHLFPTYAEAKDAVWRDPSMLFSIIPKEFISKTNESELIVYFRNGSIYQLKGADDPDSLRGAGPKGIIFDEFATMKPEVWQVTSPVLAQNSGWAWFIGTPRGRNHLYDFYMYGQEDSSSYNPEWKSWLMNAYKSGVIPPEKLEQSRLTMTVPNFNQEWNCEFLIGEGAVFRGVKAVCNSVPRKPESNHLYVMGVDLAKVTDFTVITVYDRATNHQVYQDRFQTLEWPFQKKKIGETARYYNNALVIIDATGLGDPIADDLARDRIAVEPFKISEQSKKELIEKLSIWIDQEKIKMIPTKETYDEFDNFSYEIGITGKIRYGAKPPYHDDIVMSHALAIWGLNPLVPKIVETTIPKIKLAYERLRLQHERQDSWDFPVEEYGEF